MANPVDSGQVLQMEFLPCLTLQKVAYTTATQSSAFNAGTRKIRIMSTTDCQVLVGSNPTATTSNGLYLVANRAEYFGVPNSTATPLKISAVQVAAGGTLYIDEFA